VPAPKDQSELRAALKKSAAPLEPYCVTAARVLGRNVTPADEEGRRIGKTCDLAFGYAGVVPAFRKFAPDGFTDEQIVTFNKQWRAAHRAQQHVAQVVPKFLDLRMRQAVGDPQQHIGHIGFLIEMASATRSTMGRYRHGRRGNRFRKCSRLPPPIRLGSWSRIMTPLSAPSKNGC
jgi:hypothetical protein